MANKKKRPRPAIQAEPEPDLMPAAKKAAYRVVRPRPLRFDEKIRILWPGDSAFELYDNGAYATWIRETTEQQIMGQSISHRCQADSGIQVPRYRLLPSREQQQQSIAKDHPDQLATEEAAYIRLRGQTQDEIDTKVDYDLDSDDEDWLQNRKAKAAGDALDKDGLEKLIDGFEKAKRDVMERKQTEWQRAGPGRHPTPPDKMEPGALYPVSAAMRDFADSCSSLTVRAVHNYWAKKAAASKLPLLQKFWYDKPWARLVDLTKLQHQDSSSDEEEGIPFQGKDSPQAQHHRKKAMDVQAVHDRLNHARIDLEKIRTIADQIRRREKIKRRMVGNWRLIWHHKVALASQVDAQGSKKTPGKAVGKGRPALIVKEAAKKHKAAASRLVQTKTVGRPRKSSIPERDLPKTVTAQEKDELAEGPSLRRTRTAKNAAKSQGKKLSSTENSKPAAVKATGPAAPRPMGAAAQKTAAGALLSQADVTAAEIEAVDGLAERQSPDEHTNHVGLDGTRQSSGFGDGLLPGFRICLRSTPGKPRGYVEWQATCRHGCFHLDRTSKIAELFRSHAKCRPQWKKFAQRQKESAKAYSDRLRQAFPFAQSAVKEHAAGVAKPDAADMKPRVILRQKGGLNKSAAGPGTTVSTLQDQKRLKAHKAGLAAAGGEAEDPGARLTRRVTRASQRGIQQGHLLSGQELAPAATRKLAVTQPVTNALAVQSSRTPRDAGNALDWDAETSTTSTSSSGSDTFIPPSSDMYSSEEESLLVSSPRYGRSRGSRLQNAKQPSLLGGSGEWHSGAQSDSSLSEGSCPGQFSQEHFQQMQVKDNAAWHASTSKKAREEPEKRSKNIVAAARQRARHAARRR